LKNLKRPVLEVEQAVFEMLSWYWSTVPILLESPSNLENVALTALQGFVCYCLLIQDLLMLAEGIRKSQECPIRKMKTINKMKISKLQHSIGTDSLYTTPMHMTYTQLKNLDSIAYFS
jgi:hypothetical protein